jgi:hypothetical protein
MSTRSVFVAALAWARGGTLLDALPVFTADAVYQRSASMEMKGDGTIRSGT